MVKANNAHYGPLRRSGVKRFRLYDCRHTFATRAAMSGVDLVTLAALFGYSRVQMVMRSAHPTEAQQAGAIRKLEAFRAEREVAEYGGVETVQFRFRPPPPLFLKIPPVFLAIPTVRG